MSRDSEPGPPTRHGHPSATHQRLVLASVGLAVLATAIHLFAPAGERSGSSTTTTGEGSGESRTEIETRPLVGEIDAVDLTFVAFPVVVAAAPLIVRRRGAAIMARAISAGLLFLWVLGGGLFYMPSAVLMVAAAAEAGTGHPVTKPPPAAQS